MMEPRLQKLNWLTLVVSPLVHPLLKPRAHNARKIEDIVRQDRSTLGVALRRWK